MGRKGSAFWREDFIRDLYEMQSYAAISEKEHSVIIGSSRAQVGAQVTVGLMCSSNEWWPWWPQPDVIALSVCVLLLPLAQDHSFLRTGYTVTTSTLIYWTLMQLNLPFNSRSMTKLSILFSDIPWAIWELDCCIREKDWCPTAILRLLSLKGVLESQVTLEFQSSLTFSISAIQNKYNFS